MTQSDRNLITEIRSLAKAERLITRKLLEKIAHVHERRLYADLGYPSLLAWMMGDLHYSKSAAFRRISAARLIQDIPEAKAMVEDGHINVTTLTQLKSAIQQTEKETKTRISLARKTELIAKIKNKFSDETDRVIAIEFPELRLRPVETVRAIGAEATELTVVLNKEQMEILNRVKEVTSHSHFNASVADLIEVMGHYFLRHNDPLKTKLRKIGSAAEPDSKLDQTIEVVQEPTLNKLELRASRSTPTMAASQPRRMAYLRAERVSCAKRKPLSSTIRNFVIQRDGAKCTFVSPETGHACETQVLVEIDHITAKARGGSDHPENLRPLCRAHNRLAWKMENKRQ